MHVYNATPLSSKHFPKRAGMNWARSGIPVAGSIKLAMSAVYSRAFGWQKTRYCVTFFANHDPPILTVPVFLNEGELS